MPNTKDEWKPFEDLVRKFRKDGKDGLFAVWTQEKRNVLNEVADKIEKTISKAREEGEKPPSVKDGVWVDRWDMEELIRIAWEHPKTPAEYCKEVQDKYLSKEKLSYEEREEYACEVCSNVPDEEGMIEHGRGCYTQSEDGGGESYVDFDPPTKDKG